MKKSEPSDKIKATEIYRKCVELARKQEEPNKIADIWGIAATLIDAMAKLEILTDTEIANGVLTACRENEAFHRC